MQVTLIDSMGSDLTVVNCARVSFGKKKEKILTVLYAKELLQLLFTQMAPKLETILAHLKTGNYYGFKN